MDGGILLGIFTGNHAGAEVCLGPGEYLVGTSEECDVLLSDRSLSPRHCVLRLTQDAVRLEPLEGGLSLRGKTLADPLDWPALTPVLAGLVCLAWAAPGQSWSGMTLPPLLPAAGEAMQESPLPQTPEEEIPKKAEAPPVIDAPSSPAANPDETVRKKLPPAGFGKWGLLAIAALLLLGLMLDFVPISGKNPGARAGALEKKLRERGYSSLRVEEGTGRVMVYGLVATSGDANNVREIAASQPYLVQVIVREREEFIRAVQAALAAHDIFLQVVPGREEAELQGYALDPLVENAALSWARGAVPPVFPIRSAVLTRAAVEKTLTEELERAGLERSATVTWLPGVISLAGKETDGAALATAMEATRAKLASPLAFRLLLDEDRRKSPLRASSDATPGKSEAIVTRQMTPVQGNPFGEGLFLRSVTLAGGDGRLSFITTSDGLVYFTGGLLPSGHILTGIYPDRLEFFKNGAAMAYKLQGH
jgi:type III secretion protein D